MCCTPTVRLLIVLTLPPSYRCPLNGYRAPRLLLPRSGLEVCWACSAAWSESLLPNLMEVKG